MIERHWKGTCKPDEADRYQDHLKNETFNHLAGIAGYRGARVLKREVADGMEFLVVTRWNAMEDIRKFAGADITRAVVPAPVQEMMVHCDQTAVHYQLTHEIDIN
jgi:heme-degrading monooxygenase HmoA